MTDHTDIVERLSYAWRLDHAGMHEACNEAADEITRLRAESEQGEIVLNSYVEENQRLSDEAERLRAEAEALRKALSAIVDRDFTFFDGCVDRNTITYGEIQQARAALAAQPVAGAVATDETGWLIEHSGEILPGAEQRAQVSWLRVQMKFNGYGAREFGFTHDANEALRFARKEDAEAVLAMHLGASPPDWYSKPFSVTEHMWPLVPQPQAAPAPEPSAQAVAHPSHQTVREWMPVSEALRLSDLWTAGDLDNCGQWRAAIKVLADEVRALAASPQPEPSAQGEPVALPAYGQMKWDELIAAVCEAQTGNRAVGWERDPSYYVGHQPVSINMNSLNRIVSGFVARASAPSTPPPAVVEAVPLEWPIERAADMLTAYAELVKATGRYAEEHYIPEIENVASELRGIAPKAAQPVEGER